MKYWKLKNVINKMVTVVVSTSSNSSKGVRLEPNQFILCISKQTPTMDAQIRRNFITVDKEFDNELYGFEVGVVYDESTLDSKKLEIAEAMAMEYKKNAIE